MDYNQIKEIIQKDYTELDQTRRILAMRGGRGTSKSFYLNYARALEELHTAIGPFTYNKEQFIEQIRYLKTKLPREVYKNILQYCKDKLDITL